MRGRPLVPILIVALLLAGLPAPHAVADEELAPNPGFEADADGDGIPDGWHLFSDNDAVAAAVPLAHAGARAVALTDATRLLGIARLRSDPVPLTPGATYRLSAWSFGSGEADLGIAYDWGQGAGFFPTQNVPLAMGAGWYRTTLDFVVPYGANAGVLLVYSTGPTAMRIDDVSLVAIPGDGNLVPNGNFATGGFYSYGRPDEWLLGCEGSDYSWFDGPNGTLILQPSCVAALSTTVAMAPGAYEFSLGHDDFGSATFAGFGVWNASAFVFGGDLPLTFAWINLTGHESVWSRSSASFCAPEGSAYGMVILAASDQGLSAWKDVRVVRTGDCT